ncbi:hypothetical protein ACSBR1_030434 [Camellia fascicularis]
MISVFCSYSRRLASGLLSLTNHWPPSLIVSSPRSVHRLRPIDFESALLICMLVVASVTTIWSQLQPDYAANIWNEALNKRLGTQVQYANAMKASISVIE